jgi:mRNA-degrading endonuclease RelE of RelBE toxin-antitoxin system
MRFEMTNEPLIEVGLAPEFVRRLKRLVKKFPHAAEDVQGLIARLEHGETPGDQVPGVRYTAYKVRLKSSDVTKGKSSGFRVIYYVQTRTRVILITLYIKSEQVDIRAEDIRHIIEAFESPD